MSGLMMVLTLAPLAAVAAGADRPPLVRRGGGGGGSGKDALAPIAVAAAVAVAVPALDELRVPA